MSPKRLRATTIATVFVLSVLGPRPPGVWADSRANCTAGWEWNRNSIGQDPCRVVSSLEASCRGDDYYKVPSLDGPDDSYDPPRTNTSDLMCECNTVTYSLYMACTTCQGAQSYTWMKWYIQCNNVSVAQYPYDIPNGTAIPRWAFINVTALPGQNYNDTLAMAIGRDPEATSQTESPVKKSKAGAIAGGVVGGVLVLVILVAVLALVIKRRRSRRGGYQPPIEVGLYAEQPRISKSYYNPEDPTTYPPLLDEIQRPLTQVSAPSSYNRGRGPFTKAMGAMGGWFRSS